MESDRIKVYILAIRLSFSDHRNILKSGHGQWKMDNGERLLFFHYSCLDIFSH